ncbi:hypothetical protein [Aidingimonas lacisalsi]|uniref:hypothetical protein n=1 Tax=Aidingimonas lacisalsi TaxID=2604086 RepID=UPI0011D1C633|nr:hypothetical protein [Aidingimonas lacisalsi]
MIWHLIAALFAGLATAGVALLLRLVSGKRLPRWIIPAFAGLGMLGYQIHYEYSWFNHKQSQLPDSAHVVSSDQNTVFWRPWTYIYPMTTAFNVVDREGLTLSNTDGQQVVEFILYRFEKQPADQVSHQAYLMNCSAQEMLPLTDEFEQRDTVELRHVDASSELYEVVCSPS